MTGAAIVELCRRHTLFEWSAQAAVDPIPVARAKGIYFWTPEGKRFIDFNSQLMCVNIGHGDERVVRAIQEQAAVLPYANPFMATEVRARLSVKLAEITPGDIDAFFFTNGGAEANENAIRIARMFSGRHKIGARYRSYHGGTAGALTLTGDPRRWAAEPGIPGVFRIPDFYHGIQKGSDTTEHVLGLTEEILELEGAKTVAAIIVEPVVGNSGFIAPEPGFLEGLRALADSSGALLIFDEVMTGFRIAPGGASERFGVTADLTTLGKVIGGGLPVAVYGGRRDIMQRVAPAGPVYQAGTLSGNPLAMAAGIATLTALTPALHAKIEKRTNALVEGLQKIAADLEVPLVAGCAGSMWGFFFSDRPVRNFTEAKASDVNLFRRFYHCALNRGVYLAPSAFEACFMSAAHGDAEVDTALERMKAALEEAIA
jgi:glutamate-1-semialdehyde-2,1-aminomutase